MSDLMEILVLVVGLVTILWATVVAARALWRREGVWKTFKAWLVRVADALFS